MSDLETLKGTVERVTYHNPESGWTVARLRVEGQAEYLPVVGITTGPFPGQQLILRGNWEQHQRYGRQFRFSEYEPIRPATTEAIAAYLGSGLIKGIRKRLAQSLIQHFGEQTLDILDHHPERLTEVRGIGRKLAERIREGWQEHREAHNVMIFLQRHGIGGALAVRIYQRYGGQAIEVIERDPYRLAREVQGIGFLTADRIGRQAGFDIDDPSRLQAGLLHVLHQATSQGHLFLPRQESTGAAASLLQVPAEALESPLNALQEHGWVEFEEDTLVWLPEMLAAEREVAQRLHALLSTEVETAPADDQLRHWLDQREAFGEVEFTDEQSDAVAIALREGLSVITGGPGTGKTTVIRALTDICEALGKRVGLACPTGRAAKRLEQLAGKPASTIHRLLSYDPIRHRFRHNESNPLDCDLLVIDETSMVDIPLARELLRAIKPGAQLVLVGDADQLPSVGPGNLLRDIVASEAVPVCRLTEIHRQQQGSLIVRNAHAINHGNKPVLLSRDQWLKRREDCILLVEDDVAEAADRIIKTATRSLPQMGFSPPDIQVISPMHRGAIGVTELNRRLQETFNAPDPYKPELTRGEVIFRQGDRVLQSVNNYDKGVYNGDIGYIVAVDSAEGMCVVEYDQARVQYSRSELQELELAYALTVHKSQGSEYPACVIVMHTSHYIMLQRSLLYTALTRAQQMACLVGETRAIFKAINTVTGTQRNTRLAQRLSEAT